MKKVIFATIIIIISLFYASCVLAAPDKSTNDTIFIATAAQLDAVRNGLDKFYKLSNDIDLTEYLSYGNPGYNGGAGWEPIGDIVDGFTGEFDGNGHSITGLMINRVSDGIGLFGYINNATVKNLNVRTALGGVKGYDDIGVLVGNIGGSSIIIDCSTSGSATGESNVGGLAGYYFGENIEKSSSDVNVNAKYQLGGLIGCINRGSIKNCNATGSVAGLIKVGGFVGWQQIQDSNTIISITDSYAAGNVSGDESVGGFVGELDKGEIINCLAIGVVIGEINVGGLVGFMNDGSVNTSSAVGNVEGSYQIGGLIGWLSGGHVASCDSSGSVSGIEKIGGLAGWYNVSDLDISNSLASSNSSGNVSGNDAVGGLVGGLTQGKITYSRASGIVSSDYNGGGLVGLMNDGSIMYSYADGDVKGLYQLGGLIGWLNDGIVDTCHALGSVRGLEKLGGLVGWQSALSMNSSIIINNYAKGNVNGLERAGGLVGMQESHNGGSCSIESCYATGNVVSENEGGGLVGIQVGNSGGNDSIKNSYATGNITANSYDAGGLVGHQGNDGACSIENSCATGDVKALGNAGGIVGHQLSNSGSNSVKSSYAIGNIVTSDDYDAGGLIGKQDIATGSNTITSSFRYINLTVNGTVLTENTPGNRHGGVKTADELVTQTTYSDNNWVISATGPWYWDSRGFPKLNLGTENNPFQFALASIITINNQPQTNTQVTVGKITGSLSVSATVTGGGALSYQWFTNTSATNIGGTEIAGANTANLAIPTNLSEGIYYYYCVINSPGAASVASDTARVSVIPDANVSGCSAVSYGHIMFLLCLFPFVLKAKKQ